MTERDDSPNSGLAIVTAIGEELQRVAHHRKRSWLRRNLRFGRRTVALVLAGGMVAAAAAGAATGVLDVGSVIPAGEPRGPANYRPPVEETVLAAGETPVAGPWRITGHRSEQLEDKGEVVQPAGLPCIRFTLTNPPPGTPVVGRAFCGEQGTAGFNAAGLAVREGSDRVEVILFGEAPEAASAVELVADGGRRIRAQIHEGPANVPGDIWVMSAPPGLEDENARLNWIDRNGRAAGAGINASRELESDFPAKPVENAPPPGRRFR